MIATAATQPMTMPAIAPPERPELELEYELSVAVDVCALVVLVAVWWYVVLAEKRGVY